MDPHPEAVLDPLEVDLRGSRWDLGECGADPPVAFPRHQQVVDARGDVVDPDELEAHVQQRRTHQGDDDPWLAGSVVGLQSEIGISELHSARVVLGNVVTIVLELAAVGLAVAMTRPWGRRVSGWVVVVLAGGATGLLAPILLALTLGSALQLAATGALRTDGMDDLSPWVLALVYGGFALLGVGLAKLAWHYVLDRWQRVLDGPPRPPAPWANVVGALALLPFAAATIHWGLFGPGESGPRGMEVMSQRTVLALVADLLRRR
ncbi:ZIP family transporter [Kineococcus sp. SYSU DK018]|uniref:hypothetical protein n=1 Tax=Kineococcus sp. SYSU DK018 TaxID=3383139 RepID=UPI003D7ED6EC